MGSDIPTTAQSSISGCERSKSSSSAGATFKLILSEKFYSKKI